MTEEEKKSIQPAANAGGEEAGKKMLKKRHIRPPVDLAFNYKNVEGIRQFLGEGGRIVPSRISSLSKQQQVALTREVKRARQLALIPAADKHKSLRDLSV